MRRPKLNSDIVEKVYKYVAAGNYIETVCQYLNISKQTYYNWLKKGEKAHSGLYFDFVDAIKRAEAEAEMRNVTLIQKAGSTTWQAAAWYLERKHPDKWGKREQMDLTHSGGIEIKVDWK
ncbi:MAG: IS630 transposase-related protein [Clostridiales bacterium]|jgi:transposase|nr:IS630 transposase-related protein [Clostridiales bacterium]